MVVNLRPGSRSGNKVAIQCYNECVKSIGACGKGALKEIRCEGGECSAGERRGEVMR